VASTLDIEPYLCWWIEQRVPGLVGKIGPAAIDQAVTGTCLTYQRISSRRIRSLNGGPTGVSLPRIQLDVWSRLRDDARAIADKICGTKEDPGLDGLSGLMGDPANPRVYVQSASLAHDFEEYEQPVHGEGSGQSGLYRCSRDYIIWFEETLRSS
jgi:hypothetical protein